jgi:hypothetical protein
MEAVFEKRFIFYDSYATRKGKGVHKAIALKIIDNIIIDE